MLPLTKITCNPYASIPEKKRVDHEITKRLQARLPELRPYPIVKRQKEKIALAKRVPGTVSTSDTLLHRRAVPEIDFYPRI